MRLHASENSMRQLAVALLAVMGLVYLVNVLAGSGRVDAQGDIIGCDFLAFYGAALDVQAGRTPLLYDFEHQREVQQPFAQNDSWNYYYPYVNPPFYALLVAPLARLPYLTAYCVWVGLGVLAILLSVWLLAREFGFDKRTTVTAMLLALSFPAALMNLGGGQNAAFSLLILTVCVICQHRSHDLPAGLALGLLLYKPQLVVTLAGLWLIKRRWKALLGLTLMAGGALAISAILLPEASAAYVSIAPEMHTLIHQGSYETWKQNSWYGFFTLTMHPHWPIVLRVFTAIACVLTFLLLLRAWSASRPTSSPVSRIQMAAAIVASLLISPHLYMYDLAILILPGMLLASYVRQTGEVNLLSRTLIWPTLLYVALPIWLQIARVTSIQLGPLFLLGFLFALVRLARKPIAVPPEHDGVSRSPSGSAILARIQE